MSKNRIPQPVVKWKQGKRTGFGPLVEVNGLIVKWNEQIAMIDVTQAQQASSGHWLKNRFKDVIADHLAQGMRNLKGL